MNRTDDMNSLDSVSLQTGQIALLGEALDVYDAPEMYWDDGETDDDYRRETAEEVRSRLERRLMDNGFKGSAVAFSEHEYRVTIEALTQYKQQHQQDERIADLISHLQWFKGQ